MPAASATAPRSRPRRGARSLVKERGIGVECCPVSNERMGFVPVRSHPLPLFLEEQLIVSLATDDPLMFGLFSVAETFAAIAGPLGLGDEALLRLTRNGLDSAFVTDARRGPPPAPARRSGCQQAICVPDVTLAGSPYPDHASRRDAPRSLLRLTPPHHHRRGRARVCPGSG